MNEEENELEENYENASCLKCNIIPQDYVTLNCSHNFCLICLAQNYIESYKITQERFLIICEYCGENTVMDEDSIEALENFIQENFGVMRSNNFEVIYEDSYENMQSEKKMTKSTQGTQEKNNNEGMQIINIEENDENKDRENNKEENNNFYENYENYENNEICNKGNEEFCEENIENEEIDNYENENIENKENEELINNENEEELINVENVKLMDNGNIEESKNDKSEDNENEERNNNKFGIKEQQNYKESKNNEEIYVLENQNYKQNIENFNNCEDKAMYEKSKSKEFRIEHLKKSLNTKECDKNRIEKNNFDIKNEENLQINKNNIIAGKIINQDFNKTNEKCEVDKIEKVNNLIRSKEENESKLIYFYLFLS